jgi:hypothetical protein
MDQAYSRLLPKGGQSPPAPSQFLCQLTNISECLPIQDQARVTIYIHLFSFLIRCLIE